MSGEVECMRVGVYRADIMEQFQLEPSAFRTLLNDLKPTCDFFLTVEEKLKLEDVENYDEVLQALGTIVIAVDLAVKLRQGNQVYCKMSRPPPKAFVSFNLTHSSNGNQCVRSVGHTGRKEIESQLRALCDPDKVAAQLGREAANASSTSPSKKD
eukprot:2316162-Amphidinium_carterae.3